MEKEIVLYQEALSLRDLGFKENCFGFFNINGTFIPDYDSTIDEIEKLELSDCCLAPTYGQVFRWFRDVHHINGWVAPYHSLYGIKFSYIIEGRFLGDTYLEKDEDFDTYEEAELHVLQSLLEIIKKRNHEPE